jgi:hypothetical protein
LGFPKDTKANSFDTQESQAVQYLILEKYREATFVFSRFHAGSGAPCISGDFQRKIDLLISGKEDETGAHILHFLNFHGNFYHADGKCMDSCPRNKSGSCDWVEGERAASSFARDEENKSYVNAMNVAAETAGIALRFKYSILSECELFHQKTITCNAGREFKSLRHLLTTKHPDDSVLGVGNMDGFTQEWLVEKILSEEIKGGFVVIRNGNENATDFDPNLFGFCHQRAAISREDIGPFTEEQALRYAEGDFAKAELFLQEQVGKEQTITKRSFHSRGEVIGVSYFKFLIEERKLRNFHISHFLFYSNKRFLTPWLTNLLQQRHDLKKIIASPTSSPVEKRNAALQAEVKKLTLNSFYGYSCLESCGFTTTKIWNSKTICKNAKNMAALTSEDLVQMTLCGAVNKGKKNEDPLLLYAVTLKNSKAQINNVCQIATNILSESRRVFLGKLNYLFKHLDHRKSELCYIGLCVIRVCVLVFCNVVSAYLKTQTAQFGQLFRQTCGKI